MVSRFPYLLFGFVLVGAAVAACGSSETPAAPASAPTAESTAAATSEPVTTTVPTPATTTVPVPTAAEFDQPVPIVQELDPMESVEGGNVGKVYVGTEYPPELAGIITNMIADASNRSGLAPEAVDVIAVAEVTWSDASLGCGQPGFAYAQVLTDGMRVILQLDDQFYDYRASGVDAWLLCSQSAVLASSDALPGTSEATDTADAADKSTSGLYEITEDGVVQLEAPVYDEDAPTEGTNPPDE